MIERPHFIIIGAMKCATSTLHEQLVRQPGFFMTDPKEPNFFSDDEHFAQGIDSYEELFRGAAPGCICGESSTHYTKLPTYPNTVARMREFVPNARLIYMMRDPIRRLESQYVHEWSERQLSCSIDRAVEQLPKLVQYSSYATQIEPFLASYGPDRVLPVFVPRLRADPQRELERVCQFLGYSGSPRWDEKLVSQNRAIDRLRKNWLRDAVIHAPVLRTIRQKFVPQSLRDRVKGIWRMEEPPRLGEAARTRVAQELDTDIGRLGKWLGVELTCENFADVAKQCDLNWGDAAPRPV